MNPKLDVNVRRLSMGKHIRLGAWLWVCEANGGVFQLFTEPFLLGFPNFFSGNTELDLCRLCRQAHASHCKNQAQ